ncbi:MerR family transcriptional regulator [Streptomyces sp. NPDC021356]|uniref:MerR family transcriptional regulator n=1 Tax=Streptomyces sp. NPDC021356 TaxID=3154900 RepID=UPI0033EABFA5
MKISELARRSDVTTKAVRYYESLGLITPERLANGHPDYDEVDVRLVREIRTLQHVGIPVERTRPFLECLAAGRLHADDRPASLASYRKALDKLTGRIEALTARRATLITSLDAAAHRGSSVQNSERAGTENEHYLTLPADLPAPQDDGGADHLPGTKAPQITRSTTC